MKVVRIVDGEVWEIIPEAARPVADWYGEAFAAQCVEAPDEVEQHWSYDPETREFFPPKPYDPEPEKIYTEADMLRALAGA